MNRGLYRGSFLAKSFMYFKSEKSLFKIVVLYPFLYNKYFAINENKVNRTHRTANSIKKSFIIILVISNEKMIVLYLVSNQSFGYLKWEYKNRPLQSRTQL